MSDVTRILDAIGGGDRNAAEELLPLVYEELRRLAAKMSNEAPGQTLQPTALVHEAWLRLTGNENMKWDGRAHFFGAAAEAMRRILIDNARRKKALRHGGGQHRLDIQDVDVAANRARTTNCWPSTTRWSKFSAKDPLRRPNWSSSAISPG